MSLIATCRTSVNRWECDENDHLNVRFYVQRAEEGFLLGLSQWDVQDPDTTAALAAASRSHHIRYLKEARLAAPMTGHLGLLSLTKDSLEVLTELRHSGTDEPLCTLVSSYRLTPAWYERLSQAALPQAVPLPAHAGSRGTPAKQSPYAVLSEAGARDHGYRCVGAGVIGAAECRTQAGLDDWRLIGRMSDGMPNFWASADRDADSFLGGAVLEYRIDINQRLRPHQPYYHYAAVAELSRKTYTFSHLIFDAVTGTLSASADAVAIAMDLSTRKSIEVSDTRRAQLSALQRRPLASGT
ncbi:MAG: thioesterase family protein [Pseudomonadota bacterium]